MPTDRTVPGAHGLSVRVREWTGPGAPIFLMHGFLLNSHAWDFVVEALSRPRRVFAMDCRGHGDSDPDPQFRYHHAAIGMDARAVLEALGLAAVDLVAHSTSGHAAIGLAARCPRLVKRLMLVDAGAELSTSGRGGARAAGEAEPVFENTSDYADELTRQHPRARRAVLDHLARHSLRARSDGRFEPKLDPVFTHPKSNADPTHRREFDRRAWAQQGERLLWQELGQIACPTRVVRGACSCSLSPETVRRMVAEVLTDGSSVEIPDAGHNVMLDQPEALAAAIEAFVD